MENIKDIVNNFIDLNTKKYKIIDQMFKLEMGNYNEEEYIKLVEVYSFLDWYIKNELDKYHFKNKEKMADIILVTNPDINTIDPFFEIVNSSRQEIILRKTISDLLELKFLDVSFVDKCMMKDFVNTFLITVINEAKSSNTMKDKRKLLRLKYNAIFMDEGLTDIAIKNKFKFTNKPLLVNNEKLRYTGISLNEYLKKLDGVLTEWLHDEIMSAVIKVYDLELNDVDIADGVLIKTIANLINDKKKCLGQLVVTTPDMSDNIKNAATSINKTLFKTKSGDRN